MGKSLYKCLPQVHKNKKGQLCTFPSLDSTGTNMTSLTSVFGMGTGVTKSLWPSKTIEV
jgi:hypothetical protein